MLSLLHRQWGKGHAQVVLEQWPLPSWPEAVKAFPRSLPNKEWEEHNEQIHGSPWFLERGFTQYYAPRLPKGPPPRNVLPEVQPSSSKTTKLHFTGPQRDRYQVDGYAPRAIANAGSSTDRAPNTLPVKAPPAPIRGSVARAAAVSHNVSDAETEMEEILFKAHPGEHSMENDNFTRMG